MGIFGETPGIEKSPHVIVIGNEKGGSGKTTTAMHITAALLDKGYKVGSMDLDVRQKSFTRYIENRTNWSSNSGRSLAMSQHIVVPISTGTTLVEQQNKDKRHFLEALENLRRVNDFIVIDSPGSDSFLSRLGHASADTLITPINDSFVDFDLLGKVDPDTLEIMGPSIYSELVWDCRKARAAANSGTIDWVVIRNRTSHVFAKNRQRVEKALNDLAERLRFRIAPGLSERVIFREMYPAGLTLLDLTEAEAKISLTMSHLAARAEVDELLASLNLPKKENRTTA